MWRLEEVQEGEKRVKEKKGKVDRRKKKDRKEG